MPTLTVSLAEIPTLRTGDVITHVDGRRVGPYTVSGKATSSVIPLERGQRTVDMNLYPETNIAENITVERVEGIRRPVTRTVNGIKFVNLGTREWETADGRFRLSWQESGITECENDHPVKLTRELVKSAMDNRNTGWAQPILTAHNAGKRGYLCAAGSEHSYYTWMVWDNVTGDYAYDIRSADSFTDAATALASHIA